MTSLRVENFAQLQDVEVELGDLTVLVGAQGTGKSLLLQWFKAAIDGKQVVNALRDAGQTNSDALVDFIFGVGMGPAWGPHTRVHLDSVNIVPNRLSHRGNGAERVFFIPAHRAMLIADGWASPFQKLSPETPVVARLFSQDLFTLFNDREAETLFPLERRLKKVYRDLIDDAVFHGGTVGIEEDKQRTKKLKLTHGDSQLPFMTWTAGQREFTPLLLGLYHLLPSRQRRKAKDIEWVIVEEPEMGLHPQAISAFMILVLDLLWRGYKVILSTHSPLVLTVAWMLRRLSELDAHWSRVCIGFGINDSRKQTEMKDVAAEALTKDIRAYSLAFGPNSKVRVKDISSLDPGDDDDDVSGWGGLTGFSSRFAEAVRLAVNQPRPVGARKPRKTAAGKKTRPAAGKKTR